MFAAHRRRFLDRLREQGAAAVVFTNTLKTRNHDCEYRFRPHSDFWYLTGFREPGAVLVLVPGREQGECVLFLRPRVQTEETWTGLRLGVERAKDVLGVDEARPIAELWTALAELLAGFEHVVYRAGEEEARDREMIGVLNKLRAGARNGVQAPTSWLDPAASLHELRLFKTADEVARIRRAGEVTREAHVAAMAAAGRASSEAEIDALVLHTFYKHAGREAYNNIVAGGANACILHYTENDAPLRRGDLLLIDAGCELDCYASDVTRTFPVSGTFSGEQKAIYELVLEAHKGAIEAVRPGAAFLAPHEVSQRVISEGLLELGLLTGSLDEVLEQKTYTRFFMHKTGHWLGLDVHDCGTYYRGGASRPFEPGMVTTIEPGLYVAPDDDSVDARWRGIGVRIEDDILVTDSGHENLTPGIPKEVEEVEAACQGAELAVR